MPRKKKTDDLESRGAEIAEIPPPFPEGFSTSDEYMPEPSITVPSDSTVVEPAYDKDSLADVMAHKVVSVNELQDDGSRGFRIYLGKPTLAMFEDMLRRSKGAGIIIEPDPRDGDLSVVWRKT